MFHTVTVFVGGQLCSEEYTVYSLNRPCVQCSQICTRFQCIPFASVNNMDSAEGDFELLLLAEKKAAISKKEGEPTNE